MRARGEQMVKKNAMVGDTVSFKSLTWQNRSGGTSSDSRSKLSFLATITKVWGDYEIGVRYWAILGEDLWVVDEFTGRERLKQGTTVYVGQFDLLHQ